MKGGFIERMYKNLEAELTRNGLTQNDLCKLLNLNKSTISNKMNGIRDFKLIECKKIAIWLNSTIDYLFEIKNN